MSTDRRKAVAQALVAEHGFAKREAKIIAFHVVNAARLAEDRRRERQRNDRLAWEIAQHEAALDWQHLLRLHRHAGLWLSQGVRPRAPDHVVLLGRRVREPEAAHA